MRINLIGKCFDKNSGQGIYRYSGEILERLKQTENIILTNQTGEINHVQQPELIWKALFKKRVITTVHDVMPLFNNERKFLYRLFFYLSILITSVKSKKIICDSDCTKKDLEKYFPFTKWKNTKIYLGVSGKFFPIKKREDKKIIIGYLGGLGKRKNVEFILKIAKELPELNFKIGGKGPEKENLENIKKKLDLHNVEFSGFISDEKMNEFYNSLSLFFFPSFYEGFGLPIVEAMACGVPCIISNGGSLPEIMRGSGIIIDVNNLADSLKKIKNLIKDKKKIKELSQRGVEKAKVFDWKKCVDETIKVYEEIK